MQDRVLRVGNLDAVRDFLDVRDVVEAYAKALFPPQPLELGLILNIASGVPRRIGDVLEALLTHATVPIRIEADPERMRPNDQPIAVGEFDLGHGRSCSGNPLFHGSKRLSTYSWISVTASNIDNHIFEVLERELVAEAFFALSRNSQSVGTLSPHVPRIAAMKPHDLVRQNGPPVFAVFGPALTKWLGSLTTQPWGRRFPHEATC